MEQKDFMKKQKEWFDKLCDFVFYVTFKIEDYYSQYDTEREDRYIYRPRPQVRRHAGRRAVRRRNTPRRPV